LFSCEASLIHAKAEESEGRVTVVMARRNPFPKTQGRLAIEKSSREE